MISAIICEYNPLHNGHKYHIDATREYMNGICPDEKNYIICIMSGNFTQRGEPSIFNKYTRSSHAIMSGVDMVIELPSLYATSSGNYFAYGAMNLIKLLDKVNILSFGSECADINILKEIVDITDRTDYGYSVKKKMSEGASYPVSCAEVFKEFSNIPIEILSSPNNILGIEYIRNAKKLQLNIDFFTVKRNGADYNDLNLKENYSSSSAIRKVIDSVKNINLKNNMPLYVFKELDNTINSDKFYSVIATNLLSAESVYEDNEGIINRIKKYINTSETIDELINLVHTKRYTKNKIRRILTHIALNQNNDLLNCDIDYIKVLAINELSKNLLSYTNISDLDSRLYLNDLYADNIYNIISRDKITSNAMRIIRC